MEVTSLHLTRNHCTFIILLIFTSIPQFFSQSNSSQNIPTFYPSSPLSQPHSRRSTRAAVGKAIGITAAGTIVLSAVFFILVQLYLRRRKRERKFDMNEAHATMVHPKTDNFVKFNLKGIIVDENGLDVLYWKKLQDENRTSFKKQYYHNMKDDQKEEEKRMVYEKKQETPSQVHLLREKSSTTQSLVWVEKEQVVNTISYEVGNMPNSSVQNKKIESMRTSSKGDLASNKYDGDIMEALFGYVATNRKSPSSQVFILDQLKSQDTAIVLKSLGLSRNDIIDAVLKGRGLTLDMVQKLTQIAPTEEEMSKIITYDGDVTRLANTESFLYHLLKAIPTAFTRLNIMFFRLNYSMEFPNLKESLELIEIACDELRARGFLLTKLVEAMLKAGNRMNEGSTQEFDLTALRKLSNVKSFDDKTTLLLYVVMESVRREGKRNKNHSKVTKKFPRDKKQETKDDAEREYLRLGLPSIDGLSTEFPNVKMAAVVLNYGSFRKMSSALGEQVVEMQKLVEHCGDGGGFAREMRGFLDRAELEIREVKEEEMRVMDVVKRTLDYYKGESLKHKENPLQLFVILRDFLGMVDEACVEISRIVSSPAIAGFQTIFRFPKLPADFMSETSSSTSNYQS